MTIEIKAGRYIYGIWFVHNRRMDWLACLWKDKGKDWMFTYRHRYYVDNKFHDSDDRKHWYEFALADGSLDGAVVAAKMEEAVRLVEDKMPGGHDASHFVPFKCDGGDPRVADIFKSAPWMHPRKATQEEIDRLGK